MAMHAGGHRVKTPRAISRRRDAIPRGPPYRQIRTMKCWRSCSSPGLLRWAPSCGPRPSQAGQLTARSDSFW